MSGAAERRGGDDEKSDGASISRPLSDESDVAIPGRFVG
jgi:hypothetical protein